MTLKFLQAEKQINDSVVFPAFDLTTVPGEVVALCTSVNVREQLIDILLRKTLLSNGEIQYNPNKALGFFFLIDGVYERLTVKESLKFFRQLYKSEVIIEDIVRLVQLDSKINKKLKQLTYSEKKRVQLANLLIQNPEIYIMEELDQNLDVESKRIFTNVLKQLRTAQKTSIYLIQRYDATCYFSKSHSS